HLHTYNPKQQQYTEDLKVQARQWLTTEKLSSELISGRWQVKENDGVSNETLYQGICAAKHRGGLDDGDLYKDLKHGEESANAGIDRTAEEPSKAACRLRSAPTWSPSVPAWETSKST